MKKALYLFAVFAAFSLAFVIFVGCLYPLDFFQKISLQTRDTFFKIRSTAFELPPQAEDLLLVSIDEESCRRLGQRWPWSRKTLAGLVRELDKLEVATIGLNFSFSGAEGETDAASLELAEAIRAQGRVVIGATFTPSGQMAHPHAPLAEAAFAAGYLEKIADNDGAIRRSYLLRPYASVDGYEGSFPLRLADSQASFDSDYSLLKVKGAPKPFNLNADGQWLINYLVDEKKFVKVPAWKILEHKTRSGDFQGRTVIVGLSSEVFGDRHNTPLGALSGMAIHANELVALESGRQVHLLDKNWAVGLGWAAGLFILALYLSSAFWIGLLGFAVASFGLIVGIQMFFLKDWLVEPFLVLGGVFLAFLTGVAANALSLFFDREGLRKEIIKDKLTGLYTYDFLRRKLDEEWKRCHQLRIPVSVVMTDLDRFKQINDTLGHETGNQMIIRAGEVIRQSVRGYDVVSRYGGDEFVIFLWNTNLKGAEEYRTRLRNSYEAMAKNLNEPKLHSSSISIGIAAYDPLKSADFPKSAQELIELADQDLFADKRERKARRQDP